ncbi:MAG: CRISPR-associated endonuclease Cas1 [Gemmatimonadaceae bacterium]|nr:CRISPR-associated endonuclease Cas1 [Gemmatimonadaceae bacterium]
MPIAPSSEMRPRRGVLALSGYGLRIAVERGHLTITDGAGRFRRHGRFSRVAPQLKRLIIHATSGTVSLDALSWLEAIGAHVVQLDHDGHLVAVTATCRLDDARLRRAQALALTSGVALELSRELIAAKIAGQADALDAIPNSAPIAKALRDALPHVQQARTLDRVRYVEARAAYAYWHAWESVELRFPSKHVGRIPKHWRTFGERRSPLTDSARKGVTPLNAILNYCYGIAGAEARIAVLAAGCDPGLGILHADRAGRDSLAYDVLEPVRPYVDAFVLRLAREHTFSSDDFFETNQGVCRLMPPIAHRLSETASQWAKLLHPIASRVARRFERAGAAGNVSSDSAHEAEVRHVRLPPILSSVRQKPPLSKTSGSTRGRRCRRCGAAFQKKTGVYCAACIATLPAMASAYARTALRRRQREDSGAGPSEETRALMGDARSQRAAAIREWEAKHPAIPAAHVFATEIFPTLANLRAPDVRAATGLCRSYCGRILRGQYIPHPMHWDAIRALSRDGSRSIAKK